MTSGRSVSPAAKQLNRRARIAEHDPAAAKRVALVFYCERASDFSNACGFADEASFNALVKMFEGALKISITLQNDLRDALFDRLDDVRGISHNFGYGVGDEMNILLAEYKDDI